MITTDVKTLLEAYATLCLCEIMTERNPYGMISDMLRPQKRKQKKKRSWLVGVVCAYLSLLVVFSLLGDQGLLTSYHLWKEKQRLELLTELLIEENKQLKTDIYKFRHDDATIEAYARKNLKLKGDQEIQFVWR
ncbi:MAG: septum formation initiator family protein [Bdellovibrionales bacterium]|nr:septum formation initiator family protein [Bdellovibrionales bacterium]